ncbi:hypothetical protein EDB83DRAFT_2520059 [Lactarius deliciosus]|nr:hypothetical protein EDB83DRAFT_2520059 [Lactarius deliciosus]
MALAYTPDGNHIISTGGDMIKIWDSQTGALIGTPLRGHKSTIYTMAFSPDGKHVASVALDDSIRIRDTQIGILINEHPKNLSNFVQSLSDSQDVESFWDPHQKGFMSRAKITYPHQGANNNTDQDVKATHWSHPLTIPSDGWLRTVDGGLLTHVPDEYRGRVCDLTEMCIPYDKWSRPIRFDWNGVYNVWDDIKKAM